MLRRFCAVVIVLLAVPSCSVTVTGSPGVAPTSLMPVGRNIADVLPTANELSELLSAEMPDRKSPPTVGPKRVLPNGIRSSEQATEIQCLGVTSPGLRRPYRDAPVRAVAKADWSNFGVSERIAMISVDVTVIALPSDGAARELFEEFADQWPQCVGKTVTLTKAAMPLHTTVLAVDTDTDADRLTANLSFGSDTQQTPVQRALAVQANCLVDISVKYFAPLGPPGPDDVADRLADLLTAKIADLS